MDLPAFTLHAEPLRHKFYRPKPVLASLVHLIGFGALCLFVSFAQARTYLCVDWVYERTSFGGNFVSSEQALSRLYSRRVYFWRGFRLRQVSLSAVCVRIGGLGLNFIHRRSLLARFIRCVGANLAQVLLAFVSLAQVLFALDVVCV